MGSDMTYAATHAHENGKTMGAQGIVIDNLRARVVELEDDRNLLNFIEGERDVHLAPRGPGWSIHHTGRNRIYNGKTIRLAISHCILNVDPLVPNYVYAEHAHATDADRDAGTMTEQEAQTKGFI